MLCWATVTGISNDEENPSTSPLWHQIPIDIRFELPEPIPQGPQATSSSHVQREIPPPLFRSARSTRPGTGVVLHGRWHPADVRGGTATRNELNDRPRAATSTPGTAVQYTTKELFRKISGFLLKHANCATTTLSDQKADGSIHHFSVRVKDHSFLPTRPTEQEGRARSHSPSTLRGVMWPISDKGVPGLPQARISCPELSRQSHARKARETLCLK